MLPLIISESPYYIYHTEFPLPHERAVKERFGNIATGNPRGNTKRLWF